MRTFHVKLSIQVVTEGYSIHRAAHNNTLTILAPFNTSSECTFKKITVLPKKKSHKQVKKKYYISGKYAREQTNLESFYFFVMEISCFKN